MHGECWLFSRDWMDVNGMSQYTTLIVTPTQDSGMSQYTITTVTNFSTYLHFKCHSLATDGTSKNASPGTSGVSTDLRWSERDSIAFPGSVDKAVCDSKSGGGLTHYLHVQNRVMRLFSLLLLYHCTLVNLALVMIWISHASLVTYMYNSWVICLALYLPITSWPSMMC